METILSLFIFHDVYVVSLLVAAIMVTVIWLLMSNFKSPESVVMNEVNSGENIEGALRRVLGEKNWPTASEEDADSGESSGGVSSEKLAQMEKEVLLKDKEIAELHKQITQGVSGQEDVEDNSAELMSKIDELEARLLEYEIIEDDIADLSLYKAENEKLKSELESLQAKGGAPVEAPTEEPVVEEEPQEEPVAEAAPAPEPIVESEPEPEEEVVAKSDQTWEETEDYGETGRDLVAEFEKVVNNKDAIVGDTVEVESSLEELEADLEPEAPSAGDVTVSEGKVVEKSLEETGSVAVVNPKLKDIKPDSKEEAEVFINDLKAIKKGS